MDTQNETCPLQPDTWGMEREGKGWGGGRRQEGGGGGGEVS